MDELKLDPVKINNLEFDDSEWEELCKNLESPNISENEKKRLIFKYVENLFESVRMDE